MAKAPAKKKVAKKAVKKSAKKVAKKVVVVKTAVQPKEAFIPLGEKGAIHLFVSFNDETHEGNTDDIQRTIRAIAPLRINTKTIMRFWLADSKDTKAHPRKIIEKVMMVHFARRVFSNDLAAFILAKGVMLGLGYNGE